MPPSTGESATASESDGSERPRVAPANPHRKGGLELKAVVARLRTWLPSLVVVALTLGFRVPMLLNAGAIDSDGATVGLQAIHMLRGEWSWILWGAPYQAPGDSLIAAVMFSLMGARPIALVLVPVLGQVAVAWFVFRVLGRAFEPWRAAWVTLPVVLTPMAINCCLFSVQRQLCITVFMASIWVLDGAQDARRPALRLAIGGWLGILTLYLDLFAVQWTAPLALFAIACAVRPGLDWKSRKTWVGLAAAAGGTIAGGLSVRALRSFCPPATGQISISLDHLSRNFDLLWNQALPWALGTKLYASRGHLYPDLVQFPAWFDAIRWVGAILVVLAMSTAVGLFWVRRIPWRLRRLGLLAAATIGCSLGGYLVSGMPADMWSTRYLGPIILMMPFALSPAAWLVGPRWSIVALTPYLLAATVNGWLGYGINYVDGALPVRSARGTAREEHQVAELLREHGIAYAAAQYWLSYRLTFLFHENPVVVPIVPGEDRYPPYRAGFNTARDVAYIFHPAEPRARPQDIEGRLIRAREAYERYSVADFTVLIEHRARK